jgi:hypothetical protein
MGRRIAVYGATDEALQLLGVCRRWKSRDQTRWLFGGDA